MNISWYATAAWMANVGVYVAVIIVAVLALVVRALDREP